MNSILDKRGNIPFWIHEEHKGVYFVLEGTINVYYSKIDTEGKPFGSRTFLFQILEGEPLLPVEPCDFEEGTLGGLLAIPICDSSLNRAEASLSDVMRPFIEEWVEKCYRRLGYSREKIETTCKELDQTGIEGFNSSLMLLINEKVKTEIMQTENANRRRKIGENAYFKTAINNLRSVLPGIKEQTAGFDLDSDPLILACAAVARENGMGITIPRAFQEGNVSANIVEDIALASRFRTREVILSGEWQRQENGNLLARIEKSGEPVALLQKSPRKYEIYNPATGERVKVTDENAALIAPKAVMFYRSLPMHSLSGKDIIRFVIKGTGSHDWIWVLLMGIGGGLLGMLSPEIMGRVFDTVIPDGNRSMLVQIGFLMGAMALTTCAFEITRSFSMHRISGIADRDLQCAVWDRILSLPVTFFKKYSAGELTERAMGITRILQVVSGTVTNTVITSIFSVFYMIVMFTKSVRLSLFGLGIAILVLAVSLILGWIQIKYEGRQIEVNNKISGMMFGWLSGLAKIKMSGSERRTFYNWAQMYKESREITFRKESIGNWTAVWNSIAILISSMIVYAAMFKLKDATIGAGAFIAFNAALGSLLQGCVQLSNAVIEANAIIPLYKMIKPIFEAVPEYDDSKIETPPLSGDIELSRINFSYDKDGPQIIKDVSLRIRSGEHVALVGPSGSGKSTLFRILLAFEKPDNGEIYFDGISINQLDIRTLRRQLGVVLQSGMLMAGSIFENIAGANPNITQNDALQAIKQVGMEDDLTQMPMGLHTMISEGASTISGGQRQRLLIARALVSKPRILFFDEATSALDNKTQKIVTDSINQLKATRITIAHRLSTVQECDRIIVLENGSITEEGTYAELMKLNGVFAAMASRQMA
ncbi:NHLP family bacteriocin export ABC transporter permease/ATPase subunit [Clostridia bacterium]|nr:NHLP family bacteriocin export ABC transporter permease/ATPase subunit [Clostridia bacterium]